MLCDICHRNEALIHIKEIIGSEKKELNLCEECAARQQQANSGTKPGALDQLTDMLLKLGKLAEQAAHPAEPEPEPPRSVTCPNCGWTTEQLRSSGGRLGCASCYETFSELLGTLLGTLHRGTVHLGKRPASSDPAAVRDAALAEFRRELAEAIRTEAYERAAVLRDRIRELETADSEQADGPRA